MDIKTELITLRPQVEKLIKENGKWLNEEGSENLLHIETDNKIAILQLHASDDLKPLFRVYVIINDNTEEDIVLEDLEEALISFSKLL